MGVFWQWLLLSPASQPGFLWIKWNLLKRKKKKKPCPPGKVITLQIFSTSVWLTLLMTATYSFVYLEPSDQGCINYMGAAADANVRGALGDVKGALRGAIGF